MYYLLTSVLTSLFISVREAKGSKRGSGTSYALKYVVFPSVLSPGVVSVPTPGTFLVPPSSLTTHRMVQILPWSTLSNCESFCLCNYFYVPRIFK